MTLEYAVFYLILPLLYYLIIQIHETGTLFRIAAVVNTVLVLCSYVLHATNLFYMHRFRNVFMAMCSFYLLLLLVEAQKALRTRSRDAILVLQMAGPVFFCVMIFIAMIIYLLSGGDATEYTDFSVVLMTTGPLVFAIIRFIIYIRLLADLAPQRLEFSSLNSLAYLDTLTGLNNRMMMEERFSELEKTDTDYRRL